MKIDNICRKNRDRSPIIVTENEDNNAATDQHLAQPSKSSSK